MITDILYWHWIGLGILLFILEMMLPSFISLWFGAGAMVIGAILWIFPDLPFSFQIFGWAILSCLFTALWFKYLKPLSKDKTLAGMSKEAIIGQTGQVLSTPHEHSRGMLRFPVPIVGAEEWQFISQDTVAVGDRVRVIDVSGNSLIVVKH